MRESQKFLRHIHKIRKEADGKPVLPAVYVVNSLSARQTHFGRKDKIPVCGSKLFSPTLTETEVMYKDGELWEHWKSKVQGNKWVRVAEYDYCKRCLSKVNGR